MVLPVVLLTMAVIGIAWAQGNLLHVAPQQVEQIPYALLQSPGQPQMAEPRLMSVADIEKAIGFRVVLPKDLPENCALQERFVQYEHAFLIYN